MQTTNTFTAMKGLLKQPELEGPRIWRGGNNREVR